MKFILAMFMFVSWTPAFSGSQNVGEYCLDYRSCLNGLSCVKNRCVGTTADLKSETICELCKTDNTKVCFDIKPNGDQKVSIKNCSYTPPKITCGHFVKCGCVYPLNGNYQCDRMDCYGDLSQEAVSVEFASYCLPPPPPPSEDDDDDDFGSSEGGSSGDEGSSDSGSSSGGGSSGGGDVNEPKFRCIPQCVDRMNGGRCRRSVDFCAFDPVCVPACIRRNGSGRCRGYGPDACVGSRRPPRH